MDLQSSVLLRRLVHWTGARESSDLSPSASSKLIHCYDFQIWYKPYHSVLGKAMNLGVCNKEPCIQGAGYPQPHTNNADSRACWLQGWLSMWFSNLPWVLICLWSTWLPCPVLTQAGEKLWALQNSLVSLSMIQMAKGQSSPNTSCTASNHEG